MNNDNNTLERYMPLAMIGILIILAFYFLLVAIPLASMYFVGRRVKTTTRIAAFAIAIVFAIAAYFSGPFIFHWLGWQPLETEIWLIITSLGSTVVFTLICLEDRDDARAVFGLTPIAHASNETEKKQSEQEAFKNAFHDVDDEDFDFNSSRFKNGGAETSTDSSSPSPYGGDKRHSDDAKFWAYVDDPNASDQERKIAFEKILKAQAKRKGKKKTDIVGLQ